MKSYCVNRFTRYSANDHKNTSVCFLQPISLFFLFHLCRAKASDGRSWKGEATREHCLSVTVGSGAGNSSHSCHWLDVWPWANHIFSVELAFHCVPFKISVKCCCSDLITFCVRSLCCTGGGKCQILYALFHLHFVEMIPYHGSFNLSRYKLVCVFFFFSSSSFAFFSRTKPYFQISFPISEKQIQFSLLPVPTDTTYTFISMHFFGWYNYKK